MDGSLQSTCCLLVTSTDLQESFQLGCYLLFTTASVTLNTVRLCMNTVFRSFFSFMVGLSARKSVKHYSPCISISVTPYPQSPGSTTELPRTLDPVRKLNLCSLPCRIGRTLTVDERSGVIFFDPSWDVAVATNFVGKVDLQSTPCSSHNIR